MKMRWSVTLWLALYVVAFAATWSSELIHRRDFDRAFFAWYHNRTPENEVALRFEQRKNDLLRLEDSAVKRDGGGDYCVCRVSGHFVSKAPKTRTSSRSSSYLVSSCYPRGGMDTDSQFMEIALQEARAAAEAGEVPIGAVAVREEEAIARSGNRTIRDCDPTAHAEMIVLREASRGMGNYRLAGVTLYVTVEPCSMCAGAMIQARIPRLVYGCDDSKGGAVRSCFEILSNPRLNHRVDVTAGVLAGECAAVLQRFFAQRR